MAASTLTPARERLAFVSQVLVGYQVEVAVRVPTRPPPRSDQNVVVERTNETNLPARARPARSLTTIPSPVRRASPAAAHERRGVRGRLPRRISVRRQGAKTSGRQRARASRSRAIARLDGSVRPPA
eukprot:29326-Pelagococcus_subviridis.AAC.5